MTNVGLGAKLESARKQYDVVAGTRMRALEKPMHKIEALRNKDDDSLYDSDCAQPVTSPVDIEVLPLLSRN